MALVLPLGAAEIGLAVYHSVQSSRSLAALPPVEQRALVPSQDPELLFEFKFNSLLHNAVLRCVAALAATRRLAMATF